MIFIFFTFLQNLCLFVFENLDSHEFSPNNNLYTIKQTTIILDGAWNETPNAKSSVLSNIILVRTKFRIVKHRKLRSMKHCHKKNIKRKRTKGCYIIKNDMEIRDNIEIEKLEEQRRRIIINIACSLDQMRKYPWIKAYILK